MIKDRTMAAIKKGKRWRFHGGIHPAQHKKETCDSEIKNLPIPNILILPLVQHSGTAGELLVKEGDKVKKGQPLTCVCGPRQLPIHAPTSGVIKNIGLSTACHPSGFKDECITLIPDGEDEWIDHAGCPNYQEKTPQELAQMVIDAGVVGLGGAGYPAGYKLKFAIGKIKILIINGCECEPYLTADDVLMRHEPGQILEGIKILQHILQPQITLLAVEDNKKRAIKILKEEIAKGQLDIALRVLPTIYPTGAARPLIKVLTGIEVGYDNRSNDYGITMHNVASCYAIKRAIIDGEPLLDRIVTVTGENFKENGNYRIFNGTLVKHLINYVKLNNDRTFEMILGGPMMGFSVPSIDTPMDKTIGCVIAPRRSELPMGDKYLNCIKCGRCQKVCPSNLVPYALLSHSRARNFEELDNCNFKDCIECGCCTYVCPSRIPLVMEFRKAKAEYRKRKLEEQNKTYNQELIAFRTERIENDKIQRQMRIDELKKQNGIATSSATAATNQNKSQLSPDPQAKARALALAKAKAAQAGKQVSEETPKDQQTLDPIAKARALALAKAKAAQTGKQVSEETPKDQQTLDPVAKAKALALAKAKAAQAGKLGSAESPKEQQTIDPVAKAKALALAKAKAAQAGKQVSDETPKDQDKAQQALDPVAQARALALAKAKAAQVARNVTGSKQDQEGKDNS